MTAWGQGWHFSPHLDENGSTYYEVPVEDRKKWHNYFSGQAVLLEGKKLINEAIKMA